MSLYSNWNTVLEGQGLTNAQSEQFWNEYLGKEKDIYEELLTNKEKTIKGTIKGLAERFDLDPSLMVGFFDGINESLEEELDLESLEEETEVEATIDYEKLYYNMHKAKASWLYKLPVWDELLTADKQKEIKKNYTDTVTVRIENKIGRNDPCPCGSGKKYKKCCLGKGIYEA